MTVLESGNDLKVVLPSHRYETTFDRPADLERYRKLLARAAEVVQCPHAEPTEEAFFEAGCEVVRRSDLLLAVWDGEPAAGLGGTADVVAYARKLGREVAVIWPRGASR
jgi:hypothetical protein